jgi:hypothetical protein
LWKTTETRVTVTSKNNVTALFSTYDVMFLPEQPYRYEDELYVHGYIFDRNCNVLSINASNPNIQEAVEVASKYSQFAYMCTMSHQKIIFVMMNNW